MTLDVMSNSPFSQANTRQFVVENVVVNQKTLRAISHTPLQLHSYCTCRMMYRYFTEKQDKPGSMT